MGQKELNKESFSPERSNQEVDKNKKSVWEVANKPLCIAKFVWEVANKPLCIACISSLIFAGIVSYLGAEFQQRNWLIQNKLVSQRVAEEKIFDRRAKIIGELFYLNKKQSQNLWNLHHAIKAQDKQKTNKYKEINQEIISKYSALLEEIKIFFDIKKKPKLIQNAKKIMDIWHKVHDKIIKGEGTDQFINDESKMVDNCRKKVQESFYQIMKKAELTESSQRQLIYSSPSDASPETVIF